MKAFIVVYLLAIIAAYALIGCDRIQDPEGAEISSGVIATPTFFEGLLRVFAMTQAGLAAGFIAILFAKYHSVLHEKSDMLVWPLTWVGVAFAITIFYIALDQATRFHYPITWRTPIAILAFLIADVALFILMYRVSNAMKRIPSESTSRLTVMECNTNTGESKPLM